MQKAHDASYNDHWRNLPDISSPILAEQLNRIEQSVDTIDDRVVLFDTTKANQTDLLQTVKTVTYTDSTGTFVFTLWNGTTITINTDIEKVAVNFDYDDDPTSAHYQSLIITLDDGTVKYVDLSALITEYEFTDTSTIDFSIAQDGSISAIVKDGSITEAKLEPNYLANIRIEVGKAEAAATAAEGSAEDSEAWAVGQRNGTDVPSTDETYHNNAKYYAEQAAQGAGVLTFNGRYGDVVPTDGDYSIGQISPSTGATEGQIPIVNSDGEFEMQDIPSSGHTIENTSGTSMTQREGLQFVGVFVGDDSINDRTKVNIARSMTRAQMDALTSAQKKGFIRTTDEPDNPIIDSKVTFNLTATSGNTYSSTYSNCYKVGNHVYIRAYVTGNIANTVPFATIPSQFMPQSNEICGTGTVISSSAQTHGIAAINKSDNGLRVVETVPITGTAVFVMADYEL